MNSRREQSRRIIAWVIVSVCILAPLTALGLLAQAALTHRQQPVHTGDALADSYLQALIDNDLVADEAVQWQAYALSSTPTESQRDIPESTWRELEQRFGDTADHWLLRYTCRPVRQKYLSPVAGVELWDSVSNLEQAQKRGAADWRVYYWLVREYSVFWETEAKSTLGLQDPGNKAPLDQQFAYSKQLSAEVNRRHGAARRELFAALAKTGADQAQAQYELAFHAYEDGDIAAAMRFIAAGNAASFNEAALGTPVTQLLAAAVQGRSLAGDRLLTGRLKQVYYGIPAPNYPRRRRMMRYLAQQAVESGNTPALSALERYGCRYGAAVGGESAQASVGTTFISTPVKAYRDAHPNLGAAQAQRCANISLELGKIRSELRAIPSPSFGFSTLPNARGWPAYWEVLQAVSDGNRTQVIDHLEQSCAELLARESAMAKVLLRLENFSEPLPWE